MMNNPHFDTATDTVTHLMLNVEREVNILQDAMLLPGSCPVHTVDYFDSERWFSCDHVIFLLCVVFGDKTACII